MPEQKYLDNGLYYYNHITILYAISNAHCPKSLALRLMKILRRCVVKYELKILSHSCFLLTSRKQDQF